MKNNNKKKKNASQPKKGERSKKKKIDYTIFPIVPLSKLKKITDQPSFIKKLRILIRKYYSSYRLEENVIISQAMLILFEKTTFRSKKTSEEDIANALYGWFKRTFKSICVNEYRRKKRTMVDIFASDAEGNLHYDLEAPFAYPDLIISAVYSLALEYYDDLKGTVDENKSVLISRITINYMGVVDFLKKEIAVRFPEYAPK